MLGIRSVPCTTWSTGGDRGNGIRSRNVPRSPRFSFPRDCYDLSVTTILERAVSGAAHSRGKAETRRESKPVKNWTIVAGLRDT